MLIKTLPVGQLETNCYVVSDEASLVCAVIDPGDESNTILDYLEENRLQCRAILLTHGHFDHVGAVAAVAEETGAKVYMNRRDDLGGRDAHLPFTLPENGAYYDEGDAVELPGLRFEVLATPGHTPGSVSLRCGEALFTGDTLFRGSCGRTDLSGGSTDEELASLKKLCSLPGDYEVWPGHMDATTLERERRFNYYCRQAMRL
ncbi:MAG: MBL fold metallo-hydrolase [Oscillospiraceae bacterium]|nr:MBL fold metallo-hydrolase [Oscillospiraceae bacterium]